MRYVRIFFLNCERVYEYRARIFVWFLISLLHPLIYLLFWRGMIGANKSFSSAVLSDITLYYILFIVAGGFYVHVEEDAYFDIVEGYLSAALLKPFSYYWRKFMSELPWRLIQGFFGVVSLMIFLFVGRMPGGFLSLEQVLLALTVAVFGYFILFTFKMLVLLSALWLTDIGGLQQFVEMVIIVFGGFIMPIHFFPQWVSRIAYVLPFPYMLYAPVIAFQGKLVGWESLKVIGVQLIWLMLLILIYKQVWKHGIKKYSAVGQ